MPEIEGVCRQYQVRELALFGSALRADFSTNSDVDILVTFNQEANIGLLKFLAMQEQLSELLNRRVDLVPRDGLKSVIKEDVLVNSRVIYATW